MQKLNVKTTAVLSLACGFLSAFSTGLAAAATPAGPEHSADMWTGTWGASPVFPMGQEINNQTIRQYVRVSCGGSKVRVRFSNETGSQPLVIGNAHLAVGGADGTIQAGSDHKLTFAGLDSITVPAGAPAVSDPVDLAVAPLSTLAVSMFIPRWTGLAVVHPLGVQTGYISKTGDFCTATKIEGSPNKFRFFLSGVDVSGQTGAATQSMGGAIVTFGDSITDGYASTVDANKRWPDRLAERLNARAIAPGQRQYGVVNAGISGNRLLHDAPAAMFGPNGLARFDRDVLSVSGASNVIVLEGINDIGQSTSFGLPEQHVDAAQIEAALQQIIDRAHGHGLRAIGATLLPFEGTAFANYWSAAGEAERIKVNEWIRAGHFDRFVDFDKVTRDESHPSRLKPDFDCGDHLHPNDAGYKAMGDAIDLDIFQ
ncbi:MAG: SGNH/GDSL hydrolase family protein [Cyanobacteria bacterium REEB67]|nr:SGNH/GDSL hydrolase family protein [Cyanobacteria bacterium REEB67]